MIKSFKHKGLEMFFRTGNMAGIQTKHSLRIRLILARLNVAVCIDDMNLPGLHLHKLSGKLQGFYAVRVNANWRIIFKLIQQDAYDINYLDYH